MNKIALQILHNKIRNFPGNGGIFSRFLLGKFETQEMLQSIETQQIALSFICHLLYIVYYLMWNKYVGKVFFYFLAFLLNVVYQNQPFLYNVLG